MGPQHPCPPDAIRAAGSDESPDVRGGAAEALANLGRESDALAILRPALKHDSALIRLAALNALDRMGRRAPPALEEVRAAGMREKSHAAEYVNRMVEYLPGMIEKAAR